MRSPYLLALLLTVACSSKSADSDVYDSVRADSADTGAEFVDSAEPGDTEGQETGLPQLEPVRVQAELIGERYRFAVLLPHQGTASLAVEWGAGLTPERVSWAGAACYSAEVSADGRPSERMSARITWAGVCYQVAAAQAEPDALCVQVESMTVECP